MLHMCCSIDVVTSFHPMLLRMIIIRNNRKLTRGHSAIPLSVFCFPYWGIRVTITMSLWGCLLCRL